MHFISKYILILVSVFYFCGNAIAASNKQEVYLADKPLPKIVAELKEQGMSALEIETHLKNTLPKVTPELAWEKFKIKWKDNNLQGSYYTYYWGYKTDPYIYPAVVICYINPKVGYGLFAMEDINYNDIIAEYTGKYVKADEKTMLSFIPYGWGFDNMDFIDAKDQGNVARFVLSLPMSSVYDFFDIDVNEIAFANALGVSATNIKDENDQRIIFVATENIKQFEQIGVDYGLGYWSCSMLDPELFYKNGDMIPKNKYKSLNEDIYLIDKLTNELICAEKDYVIKSYENFIATNLTDYAVLNPVDPFNPTSKKLYGQLDGFKPISENNLLKFVVETNVWQETMAKVRDVPPLITGYIVNSYTDIDKLIKLLLELKEYKVDQENEKMILNAAKENQCEKWENLI